MFIVDMSDIVTNLVKPKREKMYYALINITTYYQFFLEAAGKTI